MRSFKCEAHVNDILKRRWNIYYLGNMPPCGTVVGTTFSRERSAYIFGMKDRSVDMYHTTRPRIPEDSKFYKHCNENVRSHAAIPKLVLQTLHENKLYLSKWEFRPVLHVVSTCIGWTRNGGEFVCLFHLRNCRLNVGVLVIVSLHQKLPGEFDYVRITVTSQKLRLKTIDTIGNCSSCVWFVYTEIIYCTDMS